MKIDKVTEELLRELRKACKRYNWQDVNKYSIRLVDNVKAESIRNPEKFIAQLTTATEQYDKQKVNELVSEQLSLIHNNQDNLNEEHKETILNILKSNRYFELLEQIADAMMFNGSTNNTISRLYAQALIELGRFANAEQCLEQLIKKLPSKDPEYKEACGLRGRLHKQHYINTAAKNSMAKENLIQSIDSYKRVYSKDKAAYWHGVNLVALLERAKKSRIKLTRPLNPQRISKQILKKIEKDTSPPVFDLASAAEACLGIGDYDAALDWVVKYSQDERADAFEVASTLRQFSEVWQLDPNKPEHSKILHVLNSALLDREGGQVQIPSYNDLGVDPQEFLSDVNFEKKLGKDGPQLFQWYLNGIKRSQAVGIIKDRNGQPAGTGFLVRASDLNSSWDSSLVMVTNEHVVSNNPAGRSNPPLLPEQVRVMFEVLSGQNIQYSISEVMWSSSQDNLDVTIFRLDKEVSGTVDPYPLRESLPKLNNNERIYVIGHPEGGGLSLSIHDNMLLDHKDPKIHYRTPTEPGSSGSPVFDKNWELIAVHHAGGKNVKMLNGEGYYAANEGIWVQSVLRAINKLEQFFTIIIK